MATNRRVRAVQELRRSNAAGPHNAREDHDDEPCVCGTGFTCLATAHPEADG